METKTMVPSLSDTKLTNVVLSNGKHYSSPDDLETFYLKLTDLLDSSGLTLIFNARETSLDLYLFYLEVTRRGGYHQVGQQKKWGEVVSALKLEGNNVKLCAQVEKLYALLLYKFEKLYFYRFPATQTATGSTKVTRKENSTTSLSQLMDDGDYLTAARLSKDYPIKKLTAIPPPVLLQTPSKDKETKKRRGAPTGRSGYQIFLKQECARLKACCQDIDGKTILRTAVEAWNKMSDNDKQPYVEESKKIKEQNKEAKMIIDNKQKEQNKEAIIIDNKKKSTQDLKRDEKRPNVSGGDYYCVTSQPLPFRRFAI
ncbi:high mobility group B protein [Trifolium repens]|nr:high mobility group B protein [Trifolium repens]